MLVKIGSSEGKSAWYNGTIPEGYYCPKEIDNTLWLEGGYGDEQFKVTQYGNKVSVARIDHESYVGNLGFKGWKMDLKFHCCKTNGMYLNTNGHKGPN